MRERLVRIIKYAVQLKSNNGEQEIVKTKINYKV